MIYSAEPLAIALFLVIVVAVLGISFYFGRQKSSAKSYFAAGGAIPWHINGIAFAGDYLSAASFLGICGMIAFFGYDGFLYSIGYLAGWVVAMFVVAEPLKRMGKFTFADALDARFNSPAIRTVAGISTLVVSIFYLIPQMVGAGALVTPLLGFPHYVGVIFVGAVVIFIVATAGMKSTTYVQFIKGALLILFSIVLVGFILHKGVSTKPYDDYHNFITLEGSVELDGNIELSDSSYTTILQREVGESTFVKLSQDGIETWWEASWAEEGSGVTLKETLTIVTQEDGVKLYNGETIDKERFYQVGHFETLLHDGTVIDKKEKLNPFNFLSTIRESQVVRFIPVTFTDGDQKVQLWYQQVTPGERIMRPGLQFKIDAGSSLMSKLNFISLMIALFFGTAALPHVLIRYYTVPSAKDARKSTILAIFAIGFFYILTLYIGLGAMFNGTLDLESSNMAAPLLAKAFNTVLFAAISAIAFATVLGTVSGLIVAASGAVAHDFMAGLFKRRIDDELRVKIGKGAAVTVGLIAIALGILFKGMNVSFLVGWAFSIAASANFPAIITMLFWKKTTAQGIVASVAVGMVSSLAIILLSPSMFERYGLKAIEAPFPIDNPAIVSIPLSFAALFVVSLLTQKRKKA